MTDNKDVLEFTHKWYRIFNDPSTKEYRLKGDFGEECDHLGFKMDCGKEFCKRCGEDAFYKNEVMAKIVDRINDDVVLESAIYSKWRYITHWTEQDLFEEKNRKWFSMALNRLRMIIENESDIRN